MPHLLGTKSTRTSESSNSNSRRSFHVHVLAWMLGFSIIHCAHSFSIQSRHVGVRVSAAAVAKTTTSRNRQSLGLRPTTLPLTRLFSHFGNQTQTQTMSTTTTSTTTRAKRIGVTQHDLAAAGARIRAGDLVAFPTETVYGLGCNALDESAIAKVFSAKERPSSDPLISHVLGTEQALCLWAATVNTNTDTDTVKANNPQYQILSTLCDTFWPGPLTLVARAADTVPPSLMAHTGYCAVRSPSHPTARALIAAADCPIAAPSANKFGHVSPTTADHVWDDLSMEDVWIIETNDNDNDTLSSSCHVGVESTVAKLEMNNDNDTDDSTGTLTVLRQGAVSCADLAACLLQAGFGPDQIKVSAVQRATADHVANVAPGQTIRHYSPHIPSFLVSAKLYNQQKQQQEPSEQQQRSLQSTIVIDYGQRLVDWKEHCLEYRDLSVTGDSAEACASVFETLRWAEQVSGAERVLFPEFSPDQEQSDALAMALKDRLTRAASGVVLEKIDNDNDADGVAKPPIL